MKLDERIVSYAAEYGAKAACIMRNDERFDALGLNIPMPEIKDPEQRAAEYASLAVYFAELSQ